jgi:hypothetical protein
MSFNEFDAYMIRAAGILAFAWTTWVTHEIIQIGKTLAVIKQKVLGETSEL